MVSKVFAAAAALFLAAASASPCKPPSNTTEVIEPGTPFSLMALRSASPVHFQSFQAAKRSIFIGLPDQGATCDGDYDGPAIFTLSDAGELLLYTDSPAQKLFADRSGMGQGKLGYITGDEPIGSRWETTGWTLDSSNDLTLRDSGFLACPNSIDDAWSIWMNAGNANPGGNSGCLGITARAVPRTDAVKCSYTQE